MNLQSLVLLCSILGVSTASGDPVTKDLLWGPYRPNLYFGLRPRIPKSLSVGLMWTSGDGRNLKIQNLRHTCEQSDGMTTYGWNNYDVRDGGIQTISDPKNCIDLTIEFVKYSEASNDGSWSFRVRGNFTCPRDAAHRLTVITYISLENELDSQSSQFSCESSSLAGLDGNIECNGNSPGLGSFSILMPTPPSKGIHDTKFSRVEIPEDDVWKAKDFFIKSFNNPDFQKNDSSHRLASGLATIDYIQRSCTSDFQFDVLYKSSRSLTSFRSAVFEKAVDKLHTKFISQFYSVFRPRFPFHDEDYESFSQSLLSNLLGGIGYFYGNSKVDLSNQREYLEDTPEFWKYTAAAQSRVSPTLSKPTELYTCVPSRSAFPRGFLWDEGFHLMVVVDWDLDLAIEILQSWLALMDTDGWIAREQILGPEARSKVPPEFQVQYSYYANPPTLFLVAEAIMERLSGRVPYTGTNSIYFTDEQSSETLLSTLYGDLLKQYRWFRTTQKGSSPPVAPSSSSITEGYRWRGQSANHILTSGLDDYPRAQPPHPKDLHVDALSWVGSMASVLSKIAAELGKLDEKSTFEEHLQIVKTSLDKLHWSPSARAYCDTSFHGGQMAHVCHKGYVSLLPFLVGLLEHDHQNMKSVLDLISSSDELFSPYGLRSLSLRDDFYGKNENYWRSPVWININYLALVRLLELTQSPGPHQVSAKAIYSRLRRNVVSAVYKSWKSTGFAWEQYNPDTGAGQRTQHFTGWTSLVVKIMRMPDVPEDHHQQTHQLQPSRATSSSWQPFWIMSFLFAGVALFSRRIFRRMRNFIRQL